MLWNSSHCFAMTARPLTHRNYSVEWICALNKKLVAAIIMLDKKHPDFSISTNDQNIYIFGFIGNHNIAIACFFQGDIDTNSAATVAIRMTSIFSLIRFWLMIDIVDGMSSKIKLDDIVISISLYDHSEILQWNLGIAQSKKCFRRIEILNKTSNVLRTAVTKLKTQHVIHESEVGITSILENVQAKRPRLSAKYLRFDHLQNVLFRANYEHVNQKFQKRDEEKSIDDNEKNDDENDVIDCRYCDQTKMIKRKFRKTKIKIHYGLIASRNAMIKNARKRKKINQQRFEGFALCFEMEAAGIANNHFCIIIRKICDEIFFKHHLLFLCWSGLADYSDLHKNYVWQEFAAIVAAVYAREFLRMIASNHINFMSFAIEILMNELKNDWLNLIK